MSPCGMRPSSLAPLASQLHHRWMRRLQAFGKDDAGLAAKGPLNLAWHSDARGKLDQNEIGRDESEGALELQSHE